MLRVTGQLTLEAVAEDVLFEEQHETDAQQAEITSMNAASCACSAVSMAESSVKFESVCNHLEMHMSK